MIDHIQSLRDELSKEHPRRPVLWTVHYERGRPTEAVETQYLNLDKPCVIFFGGGAYTSIGNDAVIPQFRAIKDMLSPEISGRLPVKQRQPK